MKSHQSKDKKVHWITINFSVR